MCWKSFGEMSTGDGHKVYFSGEEDRYEHVVGDLGPVVQNNDFVS